MTQLRQLGLFGEPAPSAQEPEAQPRPGGARASRGSAVRVLQVDPARCRPWAYHNRRYDLLDADNCRDLLEGLVARGRQEFPAIVRRLRGEAGCDWEVICGVRRLWSVRHLRANGHPEFPFLVEERSLEDEDAFCLADAENRDRRDISDYERACDYRRALGAFYTTQAEMAGRLGVSPAWLSRHLDLADLPEAVLAAYPLLELKVEHGRLLKPLLQQPGTREAVLAQAQVLAAERSGGRSLSAREVTRHLRSAAEVRVQPQVVGRIAEYRTSSGQRLLVAERKGRGQVQLVVSLRAGATIEELREACGRALEAALSAPDTDA